jgi:3(or 17)beta-hydroxysteroid dehydrogenase
MNRVDGKVAFVTGGGAGLGKASCELLAAEGAKVMVSDINLALAEDTAQSIIKSGGEAVAVQHDVASEADWQQAVALTLEQFSKLDVLVNNAGICLPSRSADTSLEDWRKVQSVNLEGVFLGVRSAINAMIDNPSTGSIINIASIAGLIGDCDLSYSASKGGVRMLTKTAAIDCGRQGYNIRVNAIYPGGINTPMSAKVKHSKGMQTALTMYPLGRMAEPIEIAYGVLFLASDESSYMTGADLVMDGGITAGGGGMSLDFST